MCFSIGWIISTSITPPKSFGIGATLPHLTGSTRNLCTPTIASVEPDRGNPDTWFFHLRIPRAADSASAENNNTAMDNHTAAAVVEFNMTFTWEGVGATTAPMWVTKTFHPISAGFRETKNLMMFKLHYNDALRALAGVPADIMVVGDVVAAGSYNPQSETYQGFRCHLNAILGDFRLFPGGEMQRSFIGSQSAEYLGYLEHECYPPPSQNVSYPKLLPSRMGPLPTLCCAGSSYPTLFVDTTVNELQNQMDSNYFTAAYMTHAILAAWLKPTFKAEANIVAEPRHLIFTASFVSFFTITEYAPYSSTKAALRSLSDTLSQEMNFYASSHTPVRLHTIFPAAIFTEFFEAENKVKADITKKLKEDDAGQTADEVAKRSIAGFERGEELITTTFMTRLVMTSVLGGSIRNGWAVLDTVLNWFMSFAMVLVRRDMDSKVRTWGRENGQSGKSTPAGGMRL